MAAELRTREVPAPDKDWLTEPEVLVLLGEISGSTLDRYIRDGRFPQGVLWGTVRKWRWEDVAWFHLGQVIAARLARPEDDPPASPDTTERHGAPRKRQAASPDTT